MEGRDRYGSVYTVTTHVSYQPQAVYDVAYTIKNDEPTREFSKNERATYSKWGTDTIIKVLEKMQKECTPAADNSQSRPWTAKTCDWINGHGNITKPHPAWATFVTDNYYTVDIYPRGAVQIRIDCRVEFQKRLGRSHTSDEHTLDFSPRTETYYTDNAVCTALKSYIELLPKFPPWYLVVKEMAYKKGWTYFKEDGREGGAFVFFNHHTQARDAQVRVQYTDKTTVKVTPGTGRHRMFTFASPADETTDSTTVRAICNFITDPSSYTTPPERPPPQASVWNSQLLLALERAVITLR
jgi:hypothetical protein